MVILHEKFTFPTVNNVSDWEHPNSVSHSCTTSVDFTLNIFSEASINDVLVGHTSIA